MTPLEGFLATWSRALRTFGDGVPVPGSQICASSVLRELKAQVQSAAPVDYWRGAAAADYARSSDVHGEELGKLADLDARLACEIDESAQVVARGRAELDDVRARVVGAASSVPDGMTGQIMVMPIVSQGLDQLDAVLSKANAELNAIGIRIRQIGAEYARLIQVRS
ncbi:MAG: EspA/EspE family type VII secretion system effector [Mycolicibacterium sp.]|uniref:EspA/EspE family type VII secretion system effector n=1 Tax=Mycolicibacterium sp. TaxID=2320850 RepID=UPI003D10E51B